MLEAATYVGFIPVRDASEGRRFYMGVLGLRVLEDTPFALVVEANGTMMRITPVPGLTGQPFTSPRLAGGQTIGSLADPSAGLPVPRW